jgi:outer membrane protein TolC/anti-anti-sigma regulatory factor
MLKITIHDAHDACRLQLEGKLSGPWVGELERCWSALTSTSGAKKIVVDLADTDFVDEAGKQLLAVMHIAGVNLLAVTPVMSGVVAEVTRADRPRGRSAGYLVVMMCLASSVSPGFAQQTQQAGASLRLSLSRSVELAISPEGSARLQLADEAVKQAESRSSQARAALLPSIEASIGQQSQTRNLAALGIRVDAPIPGFEFPTFVGPFNTFDVRSSVTQSIFDFSSIRRYQASKVGITTAKSERGSTQDQVAARVAKSYLAALRADAEVEAVGANVELAKAVLEQANEQKEAGTGTGIEVTRARVQLSNEQQRLLAAENERRRARLQLLREIGLRLDTQLELTDKLTYSPMDLVTLDAVKAQALSSRADLKAQQERENQARISSSATAMERLPSLVGFADYGSIGTSINNALPTRTYGLSVRVPIFDGGRRDARRGESASLYRQERVRTHDLREQIELELRVALDAIASADEQVKVATEGLTLAENELNQARRRYGAGVASGLEVTDAQTRLERARDNQIAALYTYNVARVDFAQAQGTIQHFIQ